MIAFLIQLVQVAGQVISLIVLADIILSYFMDPYNPIRRTLDQIVQPMLAPIRRIIPPVGAFDFSPIVLLILLQVIEQVLIRIILLF